MSNSNTNLQTQSSNALHNAIIEAGSKDRLPMLAPDSMGNTILMKTLHQQRTPQVLKQKKLMQTQEDHSNPIPALNVDSLKVDLVVIQNTCSKKEDSNFQSCIRKLVKAAA
ncbi:hypothetical protein Tco_0916200 [Tanacetum coccineum]